MQTETRGDPAPASSPNYRALVFATALCCLMFELVLSRMVDFHLGASNAYLALPIAFLGLALGSLHVHLVPGSIERFSLRRQLAVLVAVTVGGLLFSFVFFSWVMPVVSVRGMMGQIDYLAKKTAVFVVVMILPFYSFGRILTTIYQLRREDIGRIYAADLLGAALACAITPVAFALGGLPTVTIVLTILALVPLGLSFPGRARRIQASVGALVLAAGVAGVVTWADSSVDYSRFEHIAPAREVEHAWNEHSRVALIELTARRSGRKHHIIVHNNSSSAVRVWRYFGEEREYPMKEFEGLEAAWVLGRDPKTILVMFAGTGAEMIRLDSYAGHQAKITGVELNGLVEEFGRHGAGMKTYGIDRFLARKNINLVIDEGRHFLTTLPEGTKFDLIYMGSNAATNAVTGHSTKYLDTVEAYETYLDLLAPGGLLVFDHQPIVRRMPNMRHVFERRGIEGFADKIIVVDSRVSNDDMIISPDGFSDEEFERVLEFLRRKDQRKARRLRYMPYADYRRPGEYRDIIEGSDPLVFTDDRPFMENLDLDSYALFRTQAQRESVRHYVSWIKITTVLVLAVLALVFIAVASLRRESRAPAPVLLYLVLTGFCFMLCEVAIMAKLELFLTQPLLSMAAVLSLFLLTSGVGSAIYPRLGRLHDTRVLAGLAAIVVLVVVAILDWMVGHLLHLGVGLKLVLAVVAVAPLGTILGLFYPHVVSCLVEQERPQTVSISYGLSTLASVVGSAYALAAMINVGFNALLFQAAGLYAGLMVFAVVYRGLGGRWLSRGP